MPIEQLISALRELKEKHGDVDVTVWQHGGGMGDLCNVTPVFDEEQRLVVLETTQHESGARR